MSLEVAAFASSVAQWKGGSEVAQTGVLNVSVFVSVLVSMFVSVFVSMFVSVSMEELFPDVACSAPAPPATTTFNFCTAPMTLSIVVQAVSVTDQSHDKLRGLALQPHGSAYVGKKFNGTES